MLKEDEAGNESLQLVRLRAVCSRARVYTIGSDMQNGLSQASWRNCALGGELKVCSRDVVIGLALKLLQVGSGAVLGGEEYCKLF